MAKAIIDLYSLKEDDRIDAIGMAAAAGNIVGVILEKNEPEKIARYIKKITEKYKSVRLISQEDGPTKESVVLKFGPTLN